MPIDQIQVFAKQMGDLADRCDYPPLRSWSTRLSGQADLFDSEGLEASLSELQDLVKQAMDTQA